MVESINFLYSEIKRINENKDNLTVSLTKKTHTHNCFSQLNFVVFYSKFVWYWYILMQWCMLSDTASWPSGSKVRPRGLLKPCVITGHPTPSAGYSKTLCSSPQSATNTFPSASMQIPQGQVKTGPIPAHTPRTLTVFHPGSRTLMHGTWPVSFPLSDTATMPDLKQAATR